MREVNNNGKCININIKPFKFYIIERLEREEAERLAAATPAATGPEYTDEQLQKLITFVKKMTVLFDLLVRILSCKDFWPKLV